MKKITLLFSLSSLFLVFFSSCGEDNVILENHRYLDNDYEIISERLNLPKEGHSYILEFPDYYRNTNFSVGNRPQDTDKITLGRVLFYDTALSGDQSISCASCHIQSKGFSDVVAQSVGVEQRLTPRNSLALGSVFSFAEYYGQVNQPGIPFLWDNSATTPEEQIRKALENENEMGIDINLLEDRIKNQADYKVLHKYAYGSEEIDKDNLIDAIGAFINSIASLDTKFDRAFDKDLYILNLNSFSPAELPNSFTSFSNQENRGMEIYKVSCGSCHGPVINAPSRLAENNGLDAEINSDLGVGEHSTLSSDHGKFKVPTLRNVALTAPYMHDGRFATLEDVVEHYSTGVKNHPNLSHDLKNGLNPRHLNLSQSDKDALVAFLHTLTDNKLNTDDKFSNPFK